MSAALSLPDVRVGDIWREVDKRLTVPRYLKILNVYPEHNGVTYVQVNNYGHGWRHGGHLARNVKLSRFHGKSGGYALHERTP